MLDMRPDCEMCGRDLPPEADALICSFECTFCDLHDLAGYPNCGGVLERHPQRAAVLLTKYPPSAVRKYAQ